MVAHPVGNEGRFDASHEGVDDHTDREQEADGIAVDVGDGGEDGRAAHEQVDRGNGLIDERVGREDQVGDGAVAHLHHLQEGLRVGRLALELDGSDGEQHDLHAGAGRVPERARDTVHVAVRGTRQQRGGNGPGGHDGGRGQTGLHRVLGGHEHLRVLDLAHVATEDPREQGHADGEGSAHADDDAVADALRQGRRDLGGVCRTHDWQQGDTR